MKLAIGFLSLAAFAFSQTAPPEPAPARPPVISPEVNANLSVTFRLRAPNAKVVNLSLEGSKAMPMEKDESGVWSVTTPPLEPDYYGYSFQMDGVSLMDPGNSS